MRHAENERYGLHDGSGERNSRRRRLVARHEPAVRVRGRRGEGQDRVRVLQQAADVVARRVAEQRVLPVLVIEEVVDPLPEALVRMHARAVVAVHRLRHERHDEAVLRGDVLDDVLVLHNPVRHVHERREAHVDLGLAGGAHLVVVHLDLDAGLLEREHHARAQVLQLVGRRDREVALLETRAVREVRGVVGARVPDAFVRVDVVVAVVRALVEAERVEDVELDLRSPVRGVRDARRRQVRFGLARDVARIAAVGLARDRVDDIGDDVHRLHVEDRIDERCARVEDQQHVALVDRLETADRAAVEADALSEQPFRELLDRDGKVLPRAGQVDEAEVDDLDPGLFGHLDDVLR